MSESDLIAEAKRLASFAPKKPESVHDVVCAGFNALYDKLREAADNRAMSNELVGALTRKVIGSLCGDPCPEAPDLLPCQLPAGHGGGWHENRSSSWPVLESDPDEPSDGFDLRGGLLP